jgi:hypothetical protein
LFGRKLSDRDNPAVQTGKRGDEMIRAALLAIESLTWAVVWGYHGYTAWKGERDPMLLLFFGTLTLKEAVATLYFGLEVLTKWPN